MPKTWNEEKMLILVVLLSGLSWSRAWPGQDSSLSKNPRLCSSSLILMEMVINMIIIVIVSEYVLGYYKKIFSNILNI